MRMNHRALLNYFYNAFIEPKLSTYLPSPLPPLRRPSATTKSLGIRYNNDHDRVVNVLKTFYFWNMVRTKGIVFAVTKFLPNTALQMRMIETYWYRKLGLRDPHRRRYRKHSDEEIQKVLELRKQGYSYNRIAKELDLPVSYVYYVCKGKIRR